MTYTVYRTLLARIRSWHLSARKETPLLIALSHCFLGALQGRRLQRQQSHAWVWEK